VCLVYKNKGCKKLLHKEVSCLQRQLEEKLSSEFQAQFDSLYSKLETVLPNRKHPTPPTIPADNKLPASDYLLFGMPSVAADSVEIPDLSKKYIMGENWRKSNQPVLNFPCLLIVVAQCRSVA
jgi:hypothetical protein